jgi:hypothetical protein
MIRPGGCSTDAGLTNLRTYSLARRGGGGLR